MDKDKATEVAQVLADMQADQDEANRYSSGNSRRMAKSRRNRDPDAPPKCNPAAGKHYITPDNAREMQRKGQEVQRKRRERGKALREIYSVMLQQQLRIDPAALGKGASTLVDAIMQTDDYMGTTLSAYEVVALAQLARAMAGDTMAAVYVRDSAGDKPTDRLQASVDTWTDGDIALLRQIGQRIAGGDT